MFGQAPQPLGDAGIAGFNLLDLRQQLVQIRPDDGFTHRVDEVLRQARQGLGCELGRFLLGRGRGLLGVKVLDPQVGVNLLEQLHFLEWLADKIVGADRQQLLAVFVHRTGSHGDDLGFLAAGGGPDPADRLMAVHHRHAEIHEDQMGPPLLELLDGLLAVGRQPDLETDGAENLHQQLAVILDVVGDQHPALRLPGPEPQDMPGLVVRLDRLRLALVQGEVNREDAALADLAAHRDVSSHQADELPADRQAEPRTGPRLLPGLGLLEMPEQLALLVGRDARAGVLDFDPEARSRRALAIRADAQADAAPLGELDGVAQHVDEHLTQLVDVGHDVSGDVADQLHEEGQLLPVRADAEHHLQVVEQAGQVERGGVQGRAAGLDLGHLQDVVDQGEQMLAAAVDGPQVLALPGVEVPVAQHQLGEPEDGVHGGADFVRHVRQEDALGAVGGFGGFLRLGHLFLGRAAAR